MTETELRDDAANAAFHASETFMLGRSFRNDREIIDAKYQAIVDAVHAVYVAAGWRPGFSDEERAALEWSIVQSEKESSARRQIRTRFPAEQNVLDAERAQRRVDALRAMLEGDA